jgi:hypothetical protein
MSNFDSKEWNSKLAAFIGYVHREDNVMTEDMENESNVILSKTKIVVEEYEDGQYKYLGRVKPKNPEDWDKERLELWNGTIRWESENRGKFIFLNRWNPNEDWNQLMRVVTALGMIRVPADINKAYNDVCVAIEDYNKDESIR